MIPHTLVLEPGLRVAKVYNGYWFFGRPTVEELCYDLCEVPWCCRPDGLSSAEHRAAWATVQGGEAGGEGSRHGDADELPVGTAYGACIRRKQPASAPAGSARTSRRRLPPCTLPVRPANVRLRLSSRSSARNGQQSPV